MSDEPIIVRIAHIRAANLCSRGTKAWFDAHGLNWSDFLSNGLPVEVLEATGDAFALKVCAIARAEADSNG